MGPQKITRRRINQVSRNYERFMKSSCDPRPAAERCDQRFLSLKRHIHLYFILLVFGIGGSRFGPADMEDGELSTTERDQVQPYSSLMISESMARR